MNLVESIALLAQHAQAIRQLAADVPPEQARWKPDAGSWSLLEVVNHLADEEREDFRTRLKHILDQTPGLPPPIDPQGWVTSRQYNQRDLTESLDRFLNAREESLVWLRGLTGFEAESAVTAPFGRLTAGDMLAAWVAHDLLHLRQMIELRYTYLRESVMPYRPDYAGDW
ncbi:MAG: DinB family protein [Anaerolineae bacterium]|nr:DinB family protein [Anaerolineae bacterium]